MKETKAQQKGNEREGKKECRRQNIGNVPEVGVFWISDLYLNEYGIKVFTI